MLLNIDIEYEKHYKSISKMESVLPLNLHPLSAEFTVGIRISCKPAQCN